MRYTLSKRILATVLTLVMVIGMLPALGIRAGAAEPTVPETVTDPGTMTAFEHMMGTSIDGTRYSGRVWADKSVFTNGATMQLATGKTQNVVLEDGEDFMIAFSVLGSSLSNSTVQVVQSKLDVVIVLDNSQSMTENNRMTTVLADANTLIDQVLAISGTRLAVVTYATGSSTILELDEYTTADLTMSSSSSSGNRPGRPGQGGNGVINASGVTVDNETKTGSSSGYAAGTNQQAGIDTAMDILAASGEEGRIPVLIVMTDGGADYADKSGWQNPGSGYQKPENHAVTHGIAMSTLLNAALGLSKVEAVYGTDAHVYTVGVDISSSDDCMLTMSPGDVFGSLWGTTPPSASNNESDATTVYRYLHNWYTGNSTVSFTDNVNSRMSWSFNQFTNTVVNGVTITKDTIWSNILYNANPNYDANDSSSDAHRYFEVGSADLAETFSEIAGELKSLTTAAFNPITSSGGTGIAAGSTPMTYVDFIGQFMELKDVRYISLFGQTFEVTKGQSVTDPATGTVTTYGVIPSATLTNPTIEKDFDISQCITIQQEVATNGMNTIRINIHEEALPILLEEVNINADGSVSITEWAYEPLRIFYTVGLQSSILDANGNVDVDAINAIDPTYIANNTIGGKICFYSNLYKEEDAYKNEVATGSYNGTAHISFTASDVNRFYFHQNNWTIYSKVTDSTGKVMTPADVTETGEFGLLYHKGGQVVGNYTLSPLTYSQVAANYADNIWAYIAFYRPVQAGSDVGESVSYLAYSSLSDLYNSMVFGYETAAAPEGGYPTVVYLNYDAATGTIVPSQPTDKYNLGMAVAPENMAAYMSALNTYMTANDLSGDKVNAYLSIGSPRITRLHHMYQNKSSNPTDTADVAYAPVYNEDTDHVGNIVVWLGNNGRLAVAPDTGIALTKTLSELDAANDNTFVFDITLTDIGNWDGSSLVVTDADGNALTGSYTYNNGSVTVEVTIEAGALSNTIYILGLPTGAKYTITERYNASYSASGFTGNTGTVQQFHVLPASFTNAPNGSLVISKDVQHPFDTAPADEFEFIVTLTGPNVANQVFQTTGHPDYTTVTTDAGGKFTVKLSDDESITVLGLPVGTAYTVEETPNAAYPLDTVNSLNLTGTITSGSAAYVHAINVYTSKQAELDLTVQGTKTFSGSWSGNHTFNFQVQKYNRTTGEFEDVPGLTATVSFTDGDATAKAYSIAMENLTFTEMGSYVYRIVEVIPDAKTPGVAYDASYGMFYVTVTDNNKDGQLEATAYIYDNTASLSGNTVTKDFVNTYDTTATEITLNIKKNISGNNELPLSGYAFRFTYVDGDPNTEDPSYERVSHADGTASITFPLTEAGVFTYTIQEVTPEAALRIPGMTYDSTVYTVTVTVTDVNSQLVAEITSVKKNSESVAVTDTYQFTNIYALTPAELTLGGSKDLTGRDVKAGDSFSFILTETDSSFHVALVGTGYAASTKTVQGEGSFTFDKITFTQPGTYYFHAHEVIPATIPGGMTYDESHYHITVHVTVDNNGQLHTSTHITKPGTGTVVDASAASSITGLDFVNTYAINDVETVVLGGTKGLTGRGLNPGEFTFILSDANGEVERVTNKADDTFSFKELSFHAPGTHYYTITELKESAGGVTYDERRYDVTVEITDNGDGTLSKAVTYKLGNQTVNTAAFENTYTAAPVTVPLNGVKELKNNVLTSEDVFTFHLYKTDHQFNVPAGATPVLTAQNGTDGKFAFADAENAAVKHLTFSKAGTYYFVVTEDASNAKDGILYDESIYHVRIVISDNGKGQLEYDVDIHSLNSGSTSLLFVNIPHEEILKKDVYVGSTSTSIDGKVVSAGDVLTYTITYTNFNSAPADATIIDHIPAYTTYVDGSATLGGVVADGYILWTLEDVAPGASVTVSFKVSVDGTETVISNEAVVRVGNNTFTSNEVVNSVPVKTVDKESATPGDTLTYTITYTNVSGAAANVTITDKLDENLSYVAGSADQNGVYADGTITWTFSNVANGETVTVTFQATVKMGGTVISNTATVLENDVRVSSSTTETEMKYPEVEAQKTQKVNGNATTGALKVQAGDVITYQFTITNKGEVTAYNVTLTDKIPAGLKFVEGSATGAVLNGDTLTWNLGDLEAGKSVTVSFKVIVPETEVATAWTNIGTVDFDNNPEEPVKSNDVTAGTDTLPKTSDEAPLLLMVAMPIFSAMGIIGMIVIRKKEWFE